MLTVQDFSFTVGAVYLFGEDADDASASGADMRFDNFSVERP